MLPLPAPLPFARLKTEEVVSVSIVVGSLVAIALSPENISSFENIKDA